MKRARYILAKGKDGSTDSPCKTQSTLYGLVQHNPKHTRCPNPERTRRPQPKAVCGQRHPEVRRHTFCGSTLRARQVWEKCWDDVVCCSDRCKNERKRQKRGAGKGDDSGGAGGAGGNSGASAALASFSFPYGAVPAPAWTSPRAALGGCGV
eukprot:363785-Chlamydomonas_euryale.AAC.9